MYTTIGRDSDGQEYVAAGKDVYRVTGYAPNGNPLGTWVSKLTPFITTGYKLYSVALEEEI